MPDAPPELHADERAYFLATMGFEYHLEGGGGHGRATITDYLTAAPGWPSTAVILTFADVLIGVAQGVPVWSTWNTKLGAHGTKRSPPAHNPTSAIRAFERTGPRHEAASSPAPSVATR